MDHLTALVSALTGLIIAVTGLAGIVYRLWVLGKRRDDKTDKRVDLIWSRDIARGEMAIQKVNTKDLEAAFAPVAPELRRIKFDLPAASAGELAEAIEYKLGDWITRHICAPLNVKDYMCLAVALQVANSEGRYSRDWKSPGPRFQTPKVDVATPAEMETDKERPV
jgi:hypothetical protein